MWCLLERRLREGFVLVGAVDTLGGSTVVVGKLTDVVPTGGAAATLGGVTVGVGMSADVVVGAVTTLGSGTVALDFD
jgi:hypothetical protein